MKAWIILPWLKGSGRWWCNGVGGIFLAHLVPIEHCLNATVYLSIVADHVHPFMTTVYHLLMYFQQDNAACHKAQNISDWFLEHDNEFTLLKWPPQSPDLNPIEHLWDVVEREIHIMDVQPTNLQQLCDAIMSIWTKISEECFQHLVESMPRRIKAVLKTKGVQPDTSKVYLIKWPMSVCVCVCVCVCICMYVCMYGCVYIYIHTHPSYPPPTTACIYIYIYTHFFL